MNDVTIERFIVGPLEVNCYLLTCEDAAILIDPGFHDEVLNKRIESLSQLESRLVLLTHGHFDHTSLCPALTAQGWKVGIHPDDAPLLNRVPPDFGHLGYPDEPFKPYMTFRQGWSYNIGSVSLEVLHTPGHSPGSVCFIDHRRRFALTGDTLFADSVGRFDLPGGDERRLADSLSNLKQSLEPQTLVLPGHGGRARFRTVLRINPFLRDQPFRQAPP